MSDRRSKNLGPQDTAERRTSLPRRRELSRALGETVLKYEEERKERGELERRNAVLEEEKYVDSVTGLLNRRAFDEKFPELVAIAQKSNQDEIVDDEPLALLFVDGNDLHNLNKNEGHSAGDNFLRTIAGNLKETARATDMVARLGGDEFGVVLTGFKPFPDVSEEKLIKDTITKYKAVLGSRASLGIAVLKPNEAADELLKRADAACTANKPVIDRSTA